MDPKAQNKRVREPEHLRFHREHTLLTADGFRQQMGEAMYDGYNIQEALDLVVGATIDWEIPYGNSASLKVYTKGDFGAWENQVWDFKPDPKHSYYISESKDGRALIHYHSALLPTPVEVQDHPDHRGVPYQVWVTRASTGYGGRAFDIKMSDGRSARLIGPWHGSAPSGSNYAELSFCDAEGPYAPREFKDGRKDQGLFMFGVYVHLKLWLAIANKYFPDLKIYQHPRYPTPTFDKAYASQEAIQQYLKTVQNTDYAYTRLKDLNIPY